MHSIAAFAVLAVVPMHDFGQRDHLFAVFMLYVMLTSARRTRYVPFGLGIAIGVAAFGAALKPTLCRPSRWK